MVNKDIYFIYICLNNMGSNSSRANNSSIIRRNSSNAKEITENDLKLVRASWKELSKISDYKTCGINMMVK